MTASCEMTTEQRELYGMNLLASILEYPAGVFDVDDRFTKDFVEDLEGKGFVKYVSSSPHNVVYQMTDEGREAAVAWVRDYKPTLLKEQHKRMLRHFPPGSQSHLRIMTADGFGETVEEMVRWGLIKVDHRSTYEDFVTLTCRGNIVRGEVVTSPRPESGQETPETISEWAIATFGDGGSDFDVLVRAHDEVNELLKLAGRDAPSALGDEVADVAIVMARYAVRRGVDIEAQKGFWLSRDFGAGAASAMEVAGQLNKAIALEIENSMLRQPKVLSYVGAVFLSLEKLALRAGSDLQTLVDAKMAVNRERVWRADGYGQGHHI